MKTILKEVLVLSPSITSWSATCVPAGVPLTERVNVAVFCSGSLKVFAGVGAVSSNLVTLYAPVCLADTSIPVKEIVADAVSAIVVVASNLLASTPYDKVALKVPVTVLPEGNVTVAAAVAPVSTTTHAFVNAIELILFLIILLRKKNWQQ